MIDRKRRLVLSLIFCPLSGIPAYVAMSDLFHTPITWIYWLILVLSLGAACTISTYYPDLIQGIAYLINTRTRIALLRAHENLEQELRLLSGEQGPELAYMSPSMAMQEVNQALTLMARAAISITPMEPYVPSKPEPRYELMLPDEGMISGVDEVDHGKVGEEHMTLTGETYEEREAWHDCGELSPGEHAMARAIREHLQADPEWRKLMD